MVSVFLSVCLYGALSRQHGRKRQHERILHTYTTGKPNLNYGPARVPVGFGSTASRGSSAVSTSLHNRGRGQACASITETIGGLVLLLLQRRRSPVGACPCARCASLSSTPAVTPELRMDCCPLTWTLDFGVDFSDRVLLLRQEPNAVWRAAGTGRDVRGAAGAEGWGSERPRRKKRGATTGCWFFR